KENEDPVVALTSHDCWAIIPVASSIEGLAEQGSCPDLSSLVATGNYPDPDDESEDEWDEEKSPAELLALDPESPYRLVANADLAVGRSEWEAAEALYLRALARLPEYTAAHFGLAVLYRRWRRPVDAARSMLEVVRSPMCFSGASFWSDSSLPC